MKIWIRFQDHSGLILIEDVWIKNNPPLAYIMTTSKYKEDSFSIGAYNSMEEAMKVLDEIKEHIEKFEYFKVKHDKRGFINE